MNPLPSLEPVALSAPDKYSRLLPEFDYARPNAVLARQLTDLGESMHDARTSMPAARQRGTPIFAGYTYFGQFIAHDLAFDDTPIPEAGWVKPSETRNYRTPWLDLDSVYGDGPGSDRHKGLYASDGQSFLLGDEVNAYGARFDVPLHQGRPQVADCRNCGNALIRQLHAIFLRLHNAALQEQPRGLPPRQRFANARTRVVWQYQWLVREKFLAKVCTDAVVTDVVRAGNRRIRYPEGRFSIPVEFSHAAARFGHSMVRESYTLSPRGGRVTLTELFASAHGNGPLSPELAVNWHHFFSNAPSMRIDRRITDPMGNLPDAAIQPLVPSPSPHPPHSLPLRTLQRGCALKLASGQQVRAALAPEARLAPPDCAYRFDPWDLLESFDFARDTPLWYYLLLEAELNESGLRLGTVGSRLLTEVIEASLRADPGSYLNQPKYEEGWRPPRWKIRDDVTIAVESPADLALVAGLETLQS